MQGSTDYPLVSYVVATYNRPGDLSDAIDSILAQDYDPIEIIVVSSSTDETGAMFEDGGRFDDDAVNYYEFDERMGVPEARNIGYEYASGDVLVTLDDDAILSNSDATDVIISQFRENEDVGALAFQSRYYDTGELIRKEIPDPPDFRTPPSESYRTTTFIGVGNAMRRSAFEAAGTYPNDFVYGFEEMDLSIRLLDARYDIKYVPSVVVLHKQSPKARRPDTEVLERHVENRIRIAVRNLPWRYVLFTAIVWSVYGFVRTRLRPSPVLRVFDRLYDQRRALLDQRAVVDDATIRLLKSRASMLFLWWIGPHPRRFVSGPSGLDRLRW